MIHGPDINTMGVRMGITPDKHEHALLMTTALAGALGLEVDLSANGEKISGRVGGFEMTPEGLDVIIDQHGRPRRFVQVAHLRAVYNDRQHPMSGIDDLVAQLDQRTATDGETWELYRIHDSRWGIMLRNRQLQPDPLYRIVHDVSLTAVMQQAIDSKRAELIEGQR